MDERKTDVRREVKIYPLLLLAFAALCLMEGIVYALRLESMRNAIYGLKEWDFEWGNVGFFAVFNIVYAFLALLFLNIYYSLVRITKSENAPLKKAVIAVSPALPFVIWDMFVSEYHPIALLVLIYIPALVYSIVSGMRGKRDLKLTTIAPVALLAALTAVNVIYLRDEYLNHIHLPVFILNCFVLRNIQVRRKQTVPINRKTVVKALKTTAAVAAICAIVSGVVYSVSTLRKIHTPVKWMGYTPDWSPQGNRIVFTGFNLKTAFALGEPVGKALIYDADTRRIEKVISLPGLPSKERIFDLLNVVASPVVWTWEKDKLFYLKNGTEGVLFNSDGTGFETIFKLPKNQFAQSSLLISPKRTKIYIIAKERIARPGRGKDFKLETVEYPYIIDLIKKKLSPLTIKGLQPIKGATNSGQEESICSGYLFNIALAARSMLRPPEPLSPPPFGKGCYSLLRYGYTGWFSEDILALEMPDCAARLPTNLMGKFTHADKNGESPNWPALDHAKILVRTDGTGLGNFPPFQSTYTPMAGDGRHFLFLDSEAEGPESCYYIGDVFNGSVDKTCCVKRPFGGSRKNAQEARFNYQARAIYDASDWVWAKVYDETSGYNQPRLFNYKTCEVNPYFTPSVVGSYLDLVGMPSVTGEYHVLSKSARERKASYKDDFDEDIIKYKYLFDYAFFYGYFRMNFTDKRSFSIFTTKGELVGSISEKDFNY